MKIDKKNPRHWLLLLRQGVYTLLASAARHLPRKREKPLVILYGHQLSGNLNALYFEWERQWQQVFDCYFLSLDPQYSEQLRAGYVQVLACGRLRDMLLVGRADVVITDHGLHAMRLFLPLTDIRFIDVWHGIPYKGFTPDNFRVQHRYDEIWVSSPRLKQIYEEQYGFRPDKVLDMGYARVDKLFRGDPPPAGLRARLDIAADRKIVLYAPTWQQDDKGRELFPFGESQQSFVQALNAVCAANSAMLVIRSHLNASIDQGEYTSVRYCSMKEFPDAEGVLQLTDILICDWSSIAFDFLALSRPTLFLDVEPPFKNGFSLDGGYRFGKVARSMNSLLDSLGNYLQNPALYHAEFGGKCQEVTAEVYGKNIDGAAAVRQCARLVTLAGTASQ